MKASMYFNYTSRSLWRGGQGTVLAVFCVTVGVMAIVALQLVGLMSNNALAMSLLSTFFFHTALGVNGFIAIGIIIAATLLAILTATLVAWGAVRVRPLEVLRYE